ncbi:MAG: hypothetical protein RI956_795 [Pseudomonadota bacterium]|jgi:hypothetical protein
MLLLNTLPAFAQTTDVIPTGGVWTTRIEGEERTFNDLQSACNAKFDYDYIKSDSLTSSIKQYPTSNIVYDEGCPFSRLTGKLFYFPSQGGFYFSSQGGYCEVEHKNTYLSGPIIDYESNTVYLRVVCGPVELQYINIFYKPPTCPAPANGQRAAADCTQTVSLTPAPGQAEPRPKGSEGDGKSTYDLIAKVTEGNQPKAGMALTFTAEVEPGSGNHPLNPPKRPPGILSVTSGTTNASGEVRLSFTSPIFAGTHKVKVTCAKCTGTVKEAESKFNVKVPNLTKIPASINWRFISNDNYHKNNNASTATQTVYYLTQPAHTGLVELTKYMVEQGWKTNSEKPASVGLNDASLEWGGKFYSYPGSGSIYPNWAGTKAHIEHRMGVQIDLRTTDLPNELKALKKQMYDKICNPQNGKYPVQAKILWHTGVQKCTDDKRKVFSCTPEHYHAYLLGNIDSKLGGGQCSSTPN